MRPADPSGWRPGRLAAALLLAAIACEGRPERRPNPSSEPVVRDATESPEYGGVGGTKYSALNRITPENLGALEVAWIYYTGDVSDGRGEIPSTSAFEGTPILVDGVLYLCTPFNRVIALDPATGAEHWTYDPRIDLSGRYANQLVCRGVSTWLDPGRDEGDMCRRRIFTATNDARLLALDAATGRPCPDFGSDGVIDLNPDAGPQLWRGEYQVTSPPAVVRDRVVVGSAVSDNARTDAPSGVVRAFDARSGALLWSWDLAPPDFDYASGPVSAAGHALGTPNVWAPMVADPERDLLIVPTGNPAPDYYRTGSPEMDYYGSSVVALRASTGAVVWRFQTVHRDHWDFDVPAQPTLVDLERDGRAVPAVIQATKMGFLFVLDRETGQPLFPVEERPVPQSGAPGDALSPTQPFPVKPPSLVPQTLTPDDAWGLTPWDRRWCRREIESLRFEGMFTAASEEWTLMYPGNLGGSNWGGVAVDPERQLLIANTSDVPWKVRLVPRAEFESTRRANPGHEIVPQRGTPFGMWREPLLSPLEVPCNAPPWGRLAAVDLRSGEIAWQRPLGTLRDAGPLPLDIELGVPNVGGPLVTRSGLVFIGAAMDDYLRAFDVASGEELWRARLPAGGQATPMTYLVQDETGGRQFVLIAAGGHGRGRTTLGDALVAFALPERTAAR
jgi:quinoprotein glucose dehydrogenase